MEVEKVDRLTKIFNGARTYLELGAKEVQLVQTKGERVIYERSFEHVTDNLNFYLQHLESSAEWITLLIPAVNLFSRTLEFPLEAEARLSEIIKFQFVDQLPCPQEEVYVSYCVVKRTKDKIKVLAFAVLKDYLDRLYNLCQRAEIKVKTIIPVPLVFYLLHSNVGAEDTNTLYVDAALNYFNFTFISSNEIYLRSSQAKDIKETKFHLLQELNQPLDVIEESKARKTDFWLTVTEASDLLAGQEFIDLSTQIRRSEWKKMRLIAGAVIVLLAINFILHWNLQQAKLEDLERKLNQVQPVVSQLNQCEREITAVRQRSEQLKQEITWQDNYLPWLVELNTIFGSEVKIEQLNFSKRRLVLLAGTAPNAGAVMDKLEESPYFENLNFTGTIKTLAVGERFKIAGDLNAEVD